MLPGGRQRRQLVGGCTLLGLGGRRTLQGAPQGEPVSFRVVEILTVRDGRIAELSPYYSDTVGLVEALTT